VCRVKPEGEGEEGITKIRVFLDEMDKKFLNMDELMTYE
jgi:hypothetical protein